MGQADCILDWVGCPSQNGIVLPPVLVPQPISPEETLLCRTDEGSCIDLSTDPLLWSFFSANNQLNSWEFKACEVCLWGSWGQDPGAARQVLEQKRRQKESVYPRPRPAHRGSCQRAEPGSSSVSESRRPRKVSDNSSHSCGNPSSITRPEPRALHSASAQTRLTGRARSRTKAQSVLPTPPPPRACGRGLRGRPYVGGGAWPGP